MILLPSMALAAMLQISCTASDISEAEAKRLAIHAAAISFGKRWGSFNAEPAALGELGTRPGTWTFHMFSQNPDPNSGSSDAGLLSVNKRTAEVTTPLATINETLGRTGAIRGLDAEQKRLRARHCLK